MANIKAPIGKYRDTIQFISIESSKDSTSGVWGNETQTVLDTIHAFVKNAGGNNLDENYGQLNLTDRIIIECRRPTTFTLDTNVFILYDNRTYRIVNINRKDNKGITYILTAESRDPAVIEV